MFKNSNFDPRFCIALLIWVSHEYIWSFEGLCNHVRLSVCPSIEITLEFNISQFFGVATTYPSLRIHGIRTPPKKIKRSSPFSKTSPVPPVFG